MVTISSIRSFIVRLYKSLRFRIFLFFILVGIIPIFLLRFVFLGNYETQAVEQKAQLLERQCQQILEQISETGYMHGSFSAQVDRLIDQMASLYSGRMTLVNSNFRIIKDTYDIDVNKVIISEEVLLTFQGTSFTNYDEKNQFLELTIPIKNDATKETDGIMIISVPTLDITNGKAGLSRTVFTLQTILIVGILLVAFYVSRILTRPFSKITQSLEDVEGVNDEEISIPDYTETQLLADSYNRMLRRMKDQEASRQEFVSNVSHELKTPITSMKVLADSLLSMDEVPEEIYRDFLSDIAQEVDRESQIISDLLSLVKMDKKASDLHIQETNINQLIELVLRRLRPIADQQHVELVLESFKPILAEVDETRLTLALSNLVENGIKYNKENGWVHVSLNIDNKYFYVKVEDSGVGIPEEAQEHIFERFYRVDKSHSSEISGTGLGLAITRSAILIHHGAIKVYSKEGEGTTFTVRIPLKYVP